MITYDDIRHNPDVRALIEAGNHALGVLGFTDHGYAHVGLTSNITGNILEQLGYDPRTCELGRIAGYMHDIGNAINRSNHALSGALLAFDILRKLDMDIAEVTAVITAIGNHDEHTAAAVTPISAALILADKSDVRRSRVRTSPTAGLRYPRPGQLRRCGRLPDGRPGTEAHHPLPADRYRHLRGHGLFRDFSYPHDSLPVRGRPSGP